jgi:hypothetical protein
MNSYKLELVISIVIEMKSTSVWECLVTLLTNYTLLSYSNISLWNFGILYNHNNYKEQREKFVQEVYNPEYSITQLDVLLS